MTARQRVDHQQHETDSAWAHPIDGLVAYVDVTNGTVDQVLDFGAMPIPQVMPP